MFNYPGTPIRLDFEVRDEVDALATADTVQFWWRVGIGGLINKEDIPVLDSTGTYHVIFTPDRGGTVYWRFSSVEPTVVSQGRLYVECTEFDEVYGNSQWV